MIHTFTVEGEPVGKGRPRFTRNGQAYTPKKTRDYEAKVRAAYLQSGGPDFAERPVCMSIAFAHGMAKSWPKKKRNELRGEVCTGRSDIDNCVKSIMDGLLGVAYQDDRSVVSVSAFKRWAEEGSARIMIYDYKGDEE